MNRQIRNSQCQTEGHAMLTKDISSSYLGETRVYCPSCAPLEKRDEEKDEKHGNHPSVAGGAAVGP
jgi:hypothetical protein